MTAKQTYLILISFVFVFSNESLLFAQTDFWKQTKGPSIGANLVAVNSTGDIFVISYRQIHRSTDNGLTWEKLPNLPRNYTPTSIVINSEDILFAGTEYGRIYRSNDNGDTWENIGSNIGSLSGSVVLALNSSGELFAASNGIYKSTDEGDSWVQLGGSYFSFNKVAINANGDIFAYIKDYGAMRSTDNGETWTLINTGLSDNSWYSQFFFHPNGNIYTNIGRSIYYSIDNGDHWVKLNFNTENNSYLYAMVINSVGNIFICYTNDQNESGIYRSTDEGVSWIQTNFHSVGLVRHLIVDSSDNLYCSTDIGVFYSNNSGEAWSKIGVPNTTITSFEIDPAGQLYAVGSSRVFRTGDFGNNWEGFPNWYQVINSIAVNTEGHIFVGTSSGVARSTDDGESWDLMNEGMPSDYYDRDVFTLIIDSSGNIYAGTETGMYRSTDNGDDWESINNGIETETGYVPDIISLAVDDNGHLFAGSESGAFRSLDHGDNWVRINDGLVNQHGWIPDVFDLDFNANGLFFAATEYGIYRSEDYGDHWSQVNAGLSETNNITSLSTVRSGFIFAGSEGGIFRSANNGEYWEQVNSGLTDLEVEALIVDSDGYVYAGTNGSGVFRSSEPTDVFYVYPGDANNDGRVDARDILPIGRYYGNTGPARENGSLDWQAQTLASLWDPFDAYYADCNGDGLVDADDVLGIIQNWYATQSGGQQQNLNRIAVCEQLLSEIDRYAESEPMKKIRSVIEKYMQDQSGYTVEYALDQNWPNPFNSSTIIQFNIPIETDRVRISIFNVTGQLIWQTIKNKVQPGHHKITWNGLSLKGIKCPSGIYYYRLQTGSYHSTKQMILLK